MQQNIRVRELRGGDVVDLAGLRSATFIGRSDHPKYRGLALVVWRLADGTISLDALAYDQVVGDMISPHEGWEERIETAMGE